MNNLSGKLKLLEMKHSEKAVFCQIRNHGLNLIYNVPMCLQLLLCMPANMKHLKCKEGKSMTMLGLTQQQYLWSHWFSLIKHQTSTAFLFA